jgi:hypothetical protein
MSTLCDYSKLINYTDLELAIGRKSR